MLKRAKESNQNKTAVEQVSKVTLTGSSVSVASLISGDLVVFVRFDRFFLLFWVLVYSSINVTNFLRNECFVFIFDGGKTMPISLYAN